MEYVTAFLVLEASGSEWRTNCLDRDFTIGSIVPYIYVKYTSLRYIYTFVVRDLHSTLYFSHMDGNNTVLNACFLSLRELRRE
jgi:hypothetical protein